MAEITLTLRCLACGHERTVRPGEIPDDDFPMCPRDGMPLVPVRANAESGVGGTNDD